MKVRDIVSNTTTRLMALVTVLSMQMCARIQQLEAIKGFPETVSLHCEDGILKTHYFTSRAEVVATGETPTVLEFRLRKPVFAFEVASSGEECPDAEVAENGALVRCSSANVDESPLVVRRWRLRQGDQTPTSGQRYFIEVKVYDAEEPAGADSLQHVFRLTTIEENCG